MSMTGITFKGKHSYKDMHVYVRTVSRPIAPPVRTIDDTVPYIDGTIDFSEQNGRLYYDDKVLELEIKASEQTDSASLHNRLSRLSAWLSGGYGELIFDDMPYIIWTAKAVDIKGICPEVYGRTGQTTIQFRCRPFNKLVFDSTGIVLDTDVVLDYDMTLDYGKGAVFDLVGGSNDIIVNYIGTAPVAPVLRIQYDEPVNGITIYYPDRTGKELSYFVDYTGDYKSLLSELVFDCKNWTCKVVVMEKDENGKEKYTTQDVSPYVRGDYFELLPGENRFSIWGGTGTITFEYYPQYLYGETDFNDSAEGGQDDTDL